MGHDMHPPSNRGTRDHRVRLPKRKTLAPTTTTEDEAEQEASQRWRDKRIKTEPTDEQTNGVVFQAGPSTKSRERRMDNGTAPRTASEALRLRHAERELATKIDKDKTKQDRQSEEEFALNALAQLPLNARLIDAAIKTFSEYHVHNSLPVSHTFRSRVTDVIDNLVKREVDEERIQQVVTRLRAAEAVTVASWFSSTVQDRELISFVCRLLLGQETGAATDAFASSCQPGSASQPRSLDSATSMPLHPASSSWPGHATGTGKT